MAKNKLAYIRYRALDKCFNNRKVKYTSTLLMEQVNKALEAYDPQTKGIGRSQFYKDIEYMESSDGWNIELDRYRDGGKEVYYRYAEEGFSIHKMPLNELEITQLKEALNVLKQFKGMPQFEWMEEVTAKLQQGIKPEETTPIIAFDANQYLKGIEWLGIIYNAIQYRKPVCITYKDFKAPAPYEVIFHPYYLNQYNNRWFAFGCNPRFESSVSTIALDRIEDIREVSTPYQSNEHIDFEEYFDDVIGVTKPNGEVVQHIEILIAPERAGYVLTKPIHGSQKAKMTEEGLYISLDVIINNELIQVLLSYGHQVKVLSPAHLQQKIRMSLADALAQY